MHQWKNRSSKNVLSYKYCIKSQSQKSRCFPVHLCSQSEATHHTAPIVVINLSRFQGDSGMAVLGCDWLSAHRAANFEHAKHATYIDLRLPNDWAVKNVIQLKDKLIYFIIWNKSYHKKIYSCNIDVLFHQKLPLAEIL